MMKTASSSGLREEQTPEGKAKPQVINLWEKTQRNNIF
jgi:hypothetical protein